MKIIILIVLFFVTIISTGGISLTAQAIDGGLAFDGRIFLDVENNGEAWYADPISQTIFYLGRPQQAFDIMRFLGLGVTNQDLAQISKANENVAGGEALAKRLSGRILLQVENHGEAWYVNPMNLKRYYLGRPTDAFAIMTGFGVGVSNNMLIQLPIARNMTNNILFNVPFTAQAPFGEWSDLRQQEGCEEASVLMAINWAKGTNFTLQEAKEKILDMSAWQKERWGYFVDTSIADTAERLLNQYFDYQNYEVRYNISTADIKAELKKGNLPIVSIDGKAVNNPQFTNGGPQRHMLVIKGYDYSSNEFITNEPGTRKGESYRYSEPVLQKALRDYPSGNQIPIPADAPTAMLIIKPNK